jgi:hypothetical protein
MKRKELTEIIGCFALLLFAAGAWTAPLPDTGQTKGYDAADNVISSSWPGQGLYGQDGNFGSNLPSYTRLDDNGNPLTDYATSWIMVKDNVTGLIWEMKTNKDGVKNYNDPHDADNTYSWYDSNPDTNGGDAGTPDKGKDTKAFIDALNDAHFGGYSDWRLPTLRELNAIVDYDIPSPGPTINTAYFPNTQSSFYWSSTTGTGYEYRAWVVGFDDGYGHNYGKYGYYYVRAVRGRQAGSTPDLKSGGQAKKLQIAFVPQNLVEGQSAGLSLPKDLPFPVLLDAHLHIAD